MFRPLFFKGLSRCSLSRTVAVGITFVSTGYGQCDAIAPATPKATSTAAQGTTGVADVEKPALSPAMPTTSPAGWTQIYSEDFKVDVPVGGFVTNDRGDLLRTGAAFEAYGKKLTTYPDGWNDTSKRAKYYPSETLSVSNSCLNIHLHTEEIGGVATAMSAAIVPSLPDTYGQLYGRASARVRVTCPTAGDAPRGWGGVFMFWQNSDTPPWPAQGEIDFPEGSFTSVMHGYAHYANPKGGQDIIETKARWTDWHIVTTEWTPNNIKFYVDGILAGTSTNQVPSTKMHYMFQCGAASDSPIDPTSEGHVQIDWIVIENPTNPTGPT